MIFFVVALALAGAGVGSAAAAGAFNGGDTYRYVTKPQPGTGHIRFVPVLNSDQVKHLDRLTWALIGPQDKNTKTVYASITPICSEVDGATVTTRSTTITVSFYGRAVTSCTPGAAPFTEYASSCRLRQEIG